MSASPDPTTPNKRVLVLMSDTGGGHRSAMEAIAEALHHLYGDTYCVEAVDAFQELTPWPFNRMTHWYAPWINHFVPVWRIQYAVTKGRRRTDFLLRLFYPYVRPRLKRLLDRPEPDVVVCVHPLFNHLPMRVMKKDGWRASFVSVVTDPVSAHPAWFNHEADLCCVATEEAECLALESGIPADNIQVTGQPVRLQFAQEMSDDRHDLRARLGLQSDLPAILLMSGGAGLGPVYQTARAIAEMQPPAQLCIVTGRNQRLQRKLEALEWEIPTRVFGFVTNMHEIMAACDLIVTKAGPGTIAEALISRLPLILSGYIPGQEEGNVRWVEQHGAGLFARDPETTAEIVCDWVKSEELLAQMSARAHALARPHAALDIARSIHALLNGHSGATHLKSALHL